MKIRITDFLDSAVGAVSFIYGKTSKRFQFKDTQGVKRYIGGRTFEYKTADYTITAEDDGKVFAASSSSSLVFTLPSSAAATKGMRVTIITETLPGSGVGTSVSPQPADYIYGNGFTLAANKDAINSAASDRIGDAITLVADGANSWYIESVTGTWAREA